MSPTAAEAPLSGRASSSLDQAPPTAAPQARFRTIFTEQVDFIGRYLRRLGVPEEGVEDAAQKTFLVLSRKLDAVATGAERSFLVATAQRIASDVRRARPRTDAIENDTSDRRDDATPPADELLDQKRAREVLDAVLDAMPIELRSVFVLFELEGLTTDEAAEALSLPRGTVASRLRRAREEFQAHVARHRRRRTQ